MVGVFERNQSHTDVGFELRTMDSGGARGLHTQGLCLTERMVRDGMQSFLDNVPGRVVCPPLFCRGEDGGLPDVVLTPPPMHNVHAWGKVCLALVPPSLLSSDSKGAVDCRGHVEGLESLTEEGRICASFNRLRSVLSSFSVILFPDMMAHPDGTKRVFANLMTLNVHLSRHLYSTRVPDPVDIARFDLHGLLMHQMTTYLSGEVGGKKLPTVNKYHTESWYFCDISQMARWQTYTKLPYGLCSEEAGEESFNLKNEYSTIVHNSTDVRGERMFEAKRKWSAQLSGAGPRAKPLFSKFTHVPFGKIIVHPTVWTWKLREIDGPFQGELRNTSFAVNLRAFLLRTYRTRPMEVLDLVYRLDNGNWVFDFGEDKGVDMVLCFSNRYAEPVADVDGSGCSCKGKCNGKTCPCHSGGLMCTSRCHPTSTSKCSRMSSPSALPPPPAGFCCFCDGLSQSEQEPGAMTLAEWGRQAELRVPRGRAPGAYVPGSKFKACLQAWRGTSNVSSTSPVSRRRLRLFYVRRLWRLTTECALNRKVEGSIAGCRYNILYKNSKH